MKYIVDETFLRLIANTHSALKGYVLDLEMQTNGNIFE